MSENAKEHAIAGAAYQRDAFGLQPVLFCSCGFAAIGDTWEEAGAMLDDHLATVSHYCGDGCGPSDLEETP